MLPKASLRFAVLAGLAGMIVGYASHRGGHRARLLAGLQGAEWFLSAGGASLLAAALRRSLMGGRDEVTERVIHVERTVVEPAPTAPRRE